MKIPFTLDAWLKDKSQRVETRDGRIVHNIWRVKEPFYANNRKAEVCALIDGEEDALVFFEGGRYLPTTQDTDSRFDLFIITPKPELSEFEKGYMRIVHKMKPEDFNDVGLKIAKEEASKLLAIARKELVEEQYTSDPRKTDLYKLGKAEALNDLPRWKKIPLGYDKPFLRYRNEYELFYKDRVIALSELEKLPGFRED